MGIIEVSCANQECDSIDVTLLNTVLLTCENKHEFQCMVCGAEFSIYTRLGRVKIPKILLMENQSSDNRGKIPQVHSSST